MTAGRPEYIDMGDHDEDVRVDAIGRAAMSADLLVAFITDDHPGKADRYVRKLKARFPGIVEVDRCNGPVKDTVTVRMRRSGGN